MGNVTRDVQVKYIPSGTAVCEVGLAINEKYKAKSGEMVDKTVFVDVTCFGRTAELAGEYLRKGSSVLFSGKLALDSWEDSATKQKRTKLKVVAETMQFIGGRDSGNSSNRETESRPRTETVSAPAGDDFFPNQPDEVPF